MDVIPVIDLKDGLVVHARRGQRQHYAPIETPLSTSADPVAVVEGLMGIHPFARLYVADLDAIGGRAPQRAALAALRRAFPVTELWLDAGPATPALCTALARVRPVGGSEWLGDLAAWQRLRRASGDAAVLSLDFDGPALRGPGALATEPACWPAQLIAMELQRVGSSAGPDVRRLAALARAAVGRAVYAAGGIRDGTDLRACRAAGAAGALVASALHCGAIDGLTLSALAAAAPARKKDAAPHRGAASAAAAPGPQPAAKGCCA